MPPIPLSNRYRLLNDYGFFFVEERAISPDGLVNLRDHTYADSVVDACRLFVEQHLGCAFDPGPPRAGQSVEDRAINYVRKVLKNLAFA